MLDTRWKRWLAHDPIHLVPRYRENLRSLSGIYVDCGSRDQYHIHYGARLLSQQLALAGIRHTYEEFDDNHSDIDYRMNVSLPFLYRALKP
jgi:S-formylglutathione hydrolase FrmB